MFSEHSLEMGQISAKTQQETAHAQGDLKEFLLYSFFSVRLQFTKARFLESKVMAVLSTFQYYFIKIKKVQGIPANTVFGCHFGEAVYNWL
jgi:hypothetical protein